MVTRESGGTHWGRCSHVITHLNSLAVKEENVRLLQVCTLADQQKEGFEVLFCVNGVTAVDGFEKVVLQLVLHE